MHFVASSSEQSCYRTDSQPGMRHPRKQNHKYSAWWWNLKLLSIYKKLSLIEFKKTPNLLTVINHESYMHKSHVSIIHLINHCLLQKLLPSNESSLDWCNYRYLSSFYSSTWLRLMLHHSISIGYSVPLCHETQ